MLESASWEGKSVIQRSVRTRGAGKLTYDVDPEQRSTLVLMARPFVKTPPKPMRRASRWRSCNSVATR